MHKVGAVRIAYDNKRLSGHSVRRWHRGVKRGVGDGGSNNALGERMPLGDGEGFVTSWGLTAAGIGDRGVESTCQGHHTW